jgi:hypothetical protein
MKAGVYGANGGSEVTGYEDVPDPVPNDGELQKPTYRFFRTASAFPRIACRWIP